MQTTTLSIGGSRQAAAGPFRGLSAVIQAIRRHRQRVRTAKALRALPDHMLKDIGLHRSELQSAAMGDPTRRRATRERR